MTNFEEVNLINVKVWPDMCKQLLVEVENGLRLSFYTQI